MKNNSPEKLEESNKESSVSMSDIESQNHEETVEELEEIVGEFVDEPEKQQQLSLKLRQYFSVNLVRGEALHDPESLKLIAQTVEKQETFRHDYLMKQVEIEGKSKEREDDRKDKELEIKESQYKDNFKITQPASYLILGIIATLTVFSIYLITNGKDAIGITLLVGIVTGVLGFLAGRGVTLYQQKE